MRKQLLLLLAGFCFAQCFGQVTNTKAGVWSDVSVWSTNRLPTASDEVLLNFDIVVDITANVQSLTLNGHKVTVNSNVQLNVLGDANTILLSRYIEIDSSAGSPADTLLQMLFSYDAAKRNTGIEQMFYDNGQLSNDGSKSTFFYNGSDTLPNKRVVITPFLNPGDQYYLNDTSYYTYLNSRIAKDSTIESRGADRYISVYKHEYTTDRIITTYTDYSVGATPVYTRKDTVYVVYANGNIVRQFDTSSFSSQKSDYRYVYDEHPNPFYRTWNEIALYNFFPYYSMETLLSDVFAKNNAVDINQDLDNYGNFHLQCAYEYKPNGYPRINRIHDQNYPTGITKGLYFYTN